MKHFARLLFGTLSCLALNAFAQTHHDPASETASIDMDSVKHLPTFQVIEFRRYVTKDGERAHFVKYFEAFFPEAFEQLGAIAFGQFTERSNPNHFTWLRGFKDISARPIINSAFYYGPLWKEHANKVNAILPDSDNVMLMRPLRTEQGVLVLPAVDPVAEPDGAHGVVVAQIFAIKKGSEALFAKQAEAAFAAYQIAGVRPAGVLVSLDVPNNFPQLPIRTDGPFLVWLGVAKDNSTLDKRLTPLLASAEKSLAETGLLRGTPERVVMDPTPRSRLRWLPNEAAKTSP